MNNMPRVNNDCGFGDFVSASQQYDGPSDGRSFRAALREGDADAAEMMADGAQPG
jgi:hypothetical protein